MGMPRLKSASSEASVYFCDWNFLDYEDTLSYNTKEGLIPRTPCTQLLCNRCLSRKVDKIKVLLDLDKLTVG